VEDEIVGAITRRSAGSYFTILGEIKIAESEEQRYGIAGHVGQLSFDDTLEN
jgi:hypothetical protein